MTAANNHPEVTTDELIDIASRMAQDLLEYIESGEEGGSPMTYSRELYEEWESIYQRTNQ